MNATLRPRANHAFPTPDNRVNCFPQADVAFALSIEAPSASTALKSLRAEVVAKRVCQTSSKELLQARAMALAVLRIAETATCFQVSSARAPGR
jgi:hypothetical protein